MQKKLLFVTASLVALGAAAPALAADLAARPYTKAPPMVAAAIYDWSGFYVGINGGYGSSHSCWNIAGFSDGCHDATGGTVGGQIGYRWQMGQLVFGVEGQGNWADLSGSNASFNNPGFSNTSRVDGFGLFTGQVGYAWNNVLLYAKGGAAVTGDRYSINDLTGAVAASTADDTRWGGTVGVGFEVGFAQNWSVGVEYDHLFMQDRTLNFAGPAAAITETVGQDVDLVTARINYKFGGPSAARY